MDWRVVATTFVTIFVAELGDKTQLATFGLAADRSNLAVFVGAGAALVLAAGIAVVAGEAVGRVVPEVWIRRGAGLLFIALGAVYLLRG